MYVYRIYADAAFELLRWRSQESNVKLPRPAFDQLLLTAHKRINANAADKLSQPPVGAHHSCGRFRKRVHEVSGYRKARFRVAIQGN